MGLVPTVLIVDDHPLFRDALEAALGTAFPDGATAHHASSLADALSKTRDLRFDLILLDLTLGDTQEFDGLTRLLATRPDCPVVVVSATESQQAFGSAKALGAAGYLPKSMSMEDLSAALATALDGGQWFPPSDAAADAGREELLARVADLTPAQRKVLSGLNDGLLNKQIAYEMDISVATVKAHMTAIFRKLGANNRTQALLIYKDAISL